MTDLAVTDTEQQFQDILGFDTELLPVSHKILMNRMIVGHSDMLTVAFEDIRVMPGLNPRIQDASYHAHVRSIADSIKQNGYFNDRPLSGYAGYEGKKPVIYLTDGFCRMAACALALAEGAPLGDLPLILKDKSCTMEDLTVAFVMSNNGKKLTPLEVAIVCKRLTSFNWNPERIAEKLLISLEYVNQLLQLAGAPRHIREMVQEGAITATLALESMRKHGPDAQDVLDAALVTAKAAGKTRLTKKFMPAQIHRKFLVKQAPRMLAVMEQIQQHQAFGSLPDDLRASIESLIKEAASKALPLADAGETVVVSEHAPADGMSFVIEKTTAPTQELATN